LSLFFFLDQLLDLIHFFCSDSIGLASLEAFLGHLGFLQIILIDVF